MDNKLFTGSGVALITPFKGGEIDYEAYGNLIDWQIEQGTDAIIACGTTGEPSTMSAEEKNAVIAFAVERAAGRIPVIAGAGTNNTAAVIESSKRAQKMGVDGLLLVTPYYNKTTQQGLVAHFTAVADSVDIPIILYNVPSRTGLNMLPETAAALCEHPNICGVKEASGNIEQITELARLCADKIALYSGNDDHILPIMSLGGQGVISVLANVMPAQTHELVYSFLNGDLQRSRELQFAMNPLVKLLFCEVNPIPAKAAVSLLGRCVDEVRLPLVPMTQANKLKLAAEMRRLGLDVKEEA